MSEYYSSVLRDLADRIASEDRTWLNASRIWAEIARGAADRIDEQQRNLAGRLEQVARLQDRVMALESKED